MQKSLFYNSVSQILTLLRCKRDDLVTLILIDNLGVATSSENGIAMVKTVVERLIGRRRSQTMPHLSVISTCQYDVCKFLQQNHVSLIS